jgi:hypothetical protein
MPNMEQSDIVRGLFYKIPYEGNEIDLCDILCAEKCEKCSCV